MKIARSIVAASLALSSLIIPGLSERAEAEKVYTGEVCTLQVHKLTSDIAWQTKLNVAEDQAQKENKLVFWMHMLGKIDGAT
jgi:hypothetical protein